MEVTQLDDLTTHLVITKEKAEPVTIDNTPELMALLYKDLYTNPALSMVQEVICNAQDAHIEAGIKDTPIQISLTDSRLIIRDFGNGIPHAKIAEIYGTFGKSTKRKNKEATGGFGFGSKSPWAFTDIFGVTSYHSGVASIYRMVKSDPEFDGKPSIVRIHHMESNETGLEVSIPLGSYDRSKLVSYIQRVVFNGGIVATLDGEPLKRVPYEEAKHGFTVLPMPACKISHKFGIKYGSVIYPLVAERSYSFYDELKNLEQKLHLPYNLIFVFHAEPNTITIAPSRDGLTYQQKTQDAILELINKQIETFTNIERYIPLVVDSIKNNSVLLDYPNVVDENFPVIQSIQDISTFLFSLNKGKLLNNLRRKYELIELSKNQPVNKKQYKIIKQGIKNCSHYHVNSYLSYLFRYFIYPIKLWAKNSETRVQLFFKTPTQDIKLPLNSSSWGTSMYSLRGTFNVPKFYSKYVVLTTRSTVRSFELANYFPNIPIDHVLWVVKTYSKKLDTYLELEQSLTQAGYKVLNIAAKEYKKPEPRKRKKKETVVKGPSLYAPLFECISRNHRGYSKKIAGRLSVENPIAYLEEKNELFLGLLSSSYRNWGFYFKNNLPKEIVVVNKTEAAFLSKQGVPHFFDFFSDFYKQFCKENKALIKAHYLRKALVEVLSKSGSPDKLNEFFENEYVAKYLGTHKYNLSKNKLIDTHIQFITAIQFSNPDGVGKYLNFVKPKVVVPPNLVSKLENLLQTPILESMPYFKLNGLLRYVRCNKSAKKFIEFLLSTSEEI